MMDEDKEMQKFAAEMFGEDLSQLSFSDDGSGSSEDEFEPGIGWEPMSMDSVTRRALAVFSWGVSKSEISCLSSEPKTEDYSDEFQVNEGRLCAGQRCFPLGCLPPIIRPGTETVHELNDNVVLPTEFSFTEFAPKIFRRLRAAFKVNEADYTASLTRKLPKLDASCRGRSKATFFRSIDGKLLIKMIDRRETGNLKKMLPMYYNFIVRWNTDTLLPQFLGLYRIRCPGNNIAREMVMHTRYLLIQMHAAPSSKIFFDLKGCHLNRAAAHRQRVGRVMVLKDLDFIGMGTRIKIGEVARKKLFALLERDVEFLTNLGIIDYSLLIGVVVTSDFDPEAEEAALEKMQFDSESTSAAPDPPPVSMMSEISLPQIDPKQRESSLLGAKFCVEHSNSHGLTITLRFTIIDTLTIFGGWNKAARFYKQLRHGRHVNTSSAHPRLYGRRFLDFLGMNID